jgi:hypothetical protein
MNRVVAEAWGLVDDGVFSEADFRDFVFANPARLYLSANPEFFAGTAVEADVASLTAGSAQAVAAR